MNAADPLHLQAQACDQSPVGLVTFKDDGSILYANPQLARWLKADWPDVASRPLDRWLAPASRIFYSTHFFPLLKMQGHIEEIHLLLRPAEGDDVPVLLTASRREDQGRMVNHCALMKIHQRKEFEAKLVEARQAAERAAVAKDQFLAVVSHELRTPLGAIMGWVRLLQSGKLDEAMVQRGIDTIERNAKSQSVLIEDLLDVSRIVSGKLRLSPRPLELASVVEAAMETGRPSAHAKNIELLAALDRAAGTVYADPDRVQQIVWNLVSNAIKFTPRGGRVQVALHRAGSRVCLQVSDTGAGIAPAQLPYVFDRFWQASEDPSRERAGLGLGLSICKSLVELHGGSIRAHSEGVGHGAAFIVEFPLAVAAASGQVKASHPCRDGTDEPVLNGIRVLVVDDDEDARTLMKMLLTSAGAEVSTAPDVQRAMLALVDQVPHILLSDIGMPGQDGYALIRQVRGGEIAAAKGMPAVAITGCSRPQDRVNLLRAGFQAHLSKPVEPSEVIALVHALVRRE